ncbi:hypothetical protein [Sphingomonas sp.]|uniref:hypothetical protein n=1 Tax=Sphingomonas sp. TaxID=28214 RepID=UPI001D3D6BC4|nr:hypothetical protein [Sphingomonas sp.]MBX9796991.1 hypothetical protein [Sphingomonas sp.]
MKAHRWQYFGMATLVGLAIALIAGGLLRPSPVIDLGPINLTPGTIVRGTFQPGYAERYAIGIRMDQKVAERLYPCVVSIEAMLRPACERTTSLWPVALSFKLSADGRDISNQIEPDNSTGGGEYEGQETYTWIAAYIRLVPGKTYQLTARSTGHASPLASARPHLVVSAAGAPGLLEGIAIAQIAELLLGAVLIAGSAVWALIGSRYRRSAKAQRA